MREVGNSMAGLEITTRVGCANACSYCPQELLLRAYPLKASDVMMSMDTFLKCLDKVPEHVVIHFSGFSEPFQNHDCARMIATARERGHQVVIYTTLHEASEEDIEAIPRHGVEVFLHVLNPAIMKICEINIDAWLEKVKFLLAQDRKFTFVRVGDGTLPGRIEKVLPDAPVFRQPLVVRSTVPGWSESPFRCEGDRQNQGVLLPNGDVALCCEDYGLEHIQGNLLNGTYRDLFTSPEHKRIQEAMAGDRRKVLCHACNRRREP